MANERNSNTVYIDSTGDISDTKNSRVVYVLLTATAANAELVLKDQVTTDNKIDLRLAISGDSKLFRFSDAPLVFPNGINIGTLTNALATLVIRNQGVVGS